MAASIYRANFRAHLTFGALHIRGLVMGDPFQRLLQFFSYEHLPPHLQATSKLFHDAAQQIAETCPCNPESITALRKLLEAKDCAVRSLIFK